jgi:hypothetical protein
MIPIPKPPTCRPRRADSSAGPPRAQASPRPNRVWSRLAAGPRLQRQEAPAADGGTPAAPPAPAAPAAPVIPAFKGKVEMKFDGINLTVTDGGTVVATLPATSGRPTTIEAADVTACKGKATDVYVNNPLYVGIKDRGAIPEGSYKLKPAELMEFSEDEQVDLLVGAAQQKKSVSVRGTPLHPGDWGRGRLELHAAKVKPGPAGCGDTSKRSAFFLHGGVLRGSAGCVDVGTAMDELAARIKAHKSEVPFAVSYAAGAGATLTSCETMLGELFYKGTMNPGLLLCLPGLRSSGDKEADAVWAKVLAKVMPGGGTAGAPGAPGTAAPKPPGLLDILKGLLP